MIVRGIALLFLLLVLPWSFAAQEQLSPYDQNIRSGPEVGEKIPPFRAIDQNGRWWGFDSLKGPHGLVLVFHRSADW